MEALGFYVCDRDLEDELVRALGADDTETLITEQGDLPALKRFQQQPAQRGIGREEQLRSFVGHAKRKVAYAPLLAERIDLAAAPRVLIELVRA